MLILFVGFETALAQSVSIFTDFESLYSIDYKKRGLVLGHIDNMTYLYDEFEDRYEVFPNEEYYMKEKESMKNGFWYSYAAASYSSYYEEFVGYIYLFQSIKPTMKMNGTISTNFLISGQRKEMSISTISDNTKSIIAIRIPSDEWLEFYNSKDIRYRLNDEVRYIETEAKSYINNTLKVLYDIKKDKYTADTDERARIKKIIEPSETDRNACIKTLGSPEAIEVSFVVDEQGKVTNISISDKYPKICITAISEALLGWEFTPAIKSGEKVKEKRTEILLFGY